MKTVRLGDVATIHSGGRLKLTGNHFVENGFPAYGAGGLNGFLSEYEYDRSAVILSSIGARCGKCFHVDGKWISLANTQVILPSDDVDSRFLWYQLNDELSWPRAGSGQPFIKPSDVKLRVISLPPLEEQRRIAAILDQADAIRAKRAEMLRSFDSIESNLFYAMFRNHSGKVDKPMNRNLGDVFTLKSGEFLPKKSQQQGPFEVFGANGMTGTHSSYLFEQPVVTIGRVGSCGAINTTSPRAWVTDNALYVAETAVPMPIEFVRAALIDAKLERYASKSNQPLISLSRIRDVQIPVPKSDLLTAFAGRVQEIEQQRRLVEAALERDNELVASLQERAFSGGL